jgi:class 3 adenylate cyclase
MRELRRREPAGLPVLRRMRPPARRRAPPPTTTWLQHRRRGRGPQVVTIVFADLIGSTSLHERLDPESVSRLMDRYYQVVRTPVEAHGGSVVQLLGDGVMCAFGIPRAGEDDAIRAVRAAAGMQRAFREFAREQRDVAGNLGLRVAVNTARSSSATSTPPASVIRSTSRRGSSRRHTTAT